MFENNSNYLESQPKQLSQLIITVRMKKNKKIEVAVRMRPLIYQYEDVQVWSINEQGKKVSSMPRCHMLRNNSTILNQEVSGLNRKKNKIEMNNIYQFAIDYVFKDSQSNREVYNQCCSKVVEQFLQGSHATIFMYGQTTSGKTYTMLGNQNTQGLIIYSLKDIFGQKDQKTTIKISYLQIYNQQINDLLKQGSVNLKIVDQNVLGLSLVPVYRIEDALDLLNEGEYQRAYAEKKYHDHSSRSHTIFQIKIMQNESKVKAILNLVDLSGSQRLSDQDSNEETAYINKSLFVLSNVIHKLANPKKNSHIPFRDSKLTRLLAPSLTTSKKTIVICTISPAQINFSQTLSTLRFATQSRKIELKGLDQSINQSTTEVNRRKMSQLIQQNSILKKNLSFAQDNKENEQKYVESKIKGIQELIQKKQIKVDSSLKKVEWRRKVQTLCEQYQKNIQILQKEYFKAIVNLTSKEFNFQKTALNKLLDKLNMSSHPNQQ